MALFLSNGCFAMQLFENSYPQTDVFIGPLHYMYLLLPITPPPKKSIFNMNTLCDFSVCRETSPGSWSDTMSVDGSDSLETSCLKEERGISNVGDVHCKRKRFIVHMDSLISLASSIAFCLRF